VREGEEGKGSARCVGGSGRGVGSERACARGIGAHLHDANGREDGRLEGKVGQLLDLPVRPRPTHVRRRWGNGACALRLVFVLYIDRNDRDARRWEIVHGVLADARGSDH